MALNRDVESCYFAAQTMRTKVILSDDIFLNFLKQIQKPCRRSLMLFPSKDSKMVCSVPYTEIGVGDPCLLDAE